MDQKEIRLIEVPYHIGYIDDGMALGPTKLIDSGIADSLRETGRKVSQGRAIRPENPRDAESAILDVNRVVKKHVEAAIADQEFPLILSGGCSVSLGILAAMETAKTGIVWFDAHGDYNTPETTPSGYFGGMPLAVANGLGDLNQWRGLTGKAPLQGSITLLIGARDLDPGEIDNLKNSQAVIIRGDAFSNHTALPQLETSLRAFTSQVNGLYLHLDIDVLDPVLAPGVTYPSPGGLTLNQLTEALSLIGAMIPVRAAALTAFNPAKDTNNLTLACARTLVQTMVDTLIPPSV